MKEIDADGINGDTQDGVPLGFSLAAEKIGHPLAFEPEDSPSDEALAWNVMTWGQYSFPSSPWSTATSGLRRGTWSTSATAGTCDKTNDLQFAFFNGVGWESWENVWGIWIGITPRDAEATRRVATIERGVAPFLVSPDWEPLYPMHTTASTPAAGRSATRRSGPSSIATAMTMDGSRWMSRSSAGMRYFDLYHGVELKPEMKAATDDVLSFAIEANGYGAILATPGEPSEAITILMEQMAAMTAKPLESFSHEWPRSCSRRWSTSRQPSRDRSAGRHGQDSRAASFASKCRESRSKAARRTWRRCAISVGGFAAPLPRAHDARSSPSSSTNIPSPMRSSSSFSTPPTTRRGQDQLSARLEERQGQHVSGRLG